MTEAPLPRWRRLLFGTALMLGMPMAVITLIEGCSSLVLWQRDHWSRTLTTAERRHVDYDTLLGWVSQPNFYDRDFYARDVYLRTNAQGFRNDHVITPRVPPGRIRVVCSGDSFTFGFGVDNDHTWCALLERMIPRLETVNLAESGYGLDQAYLRYKRDARTLNHNVHILAVIMDDFKRMRQGYFQGYGKPVLRLDGDTLRLENVPVPRWSYRMPRLAPYLFRKRQAITELRTAVLMKRLQQRIARHRSSPDDQSVIGQIVDRVLSDLASLNRAKNSQLVVVLLPAHEDWSDTTRESWRHMLNAAAARDGYLFVDLQDEFRRLRRDSLDLLFFARHDLHGHYGDAGQRWVADRLHEQLQASLKIAPLLK